MGVDDGVIIHAGDNFALMETNINTVTEDISLGSDFNIYFYSNLQSGVWANRKGMVFNNSGRLGVNNTAPGYNLDVSGTARITTNLYFNNQVQNNMITLYGSTALNSTTSFGFGINSSTLRYNVPTGSVHRWYVGTTNVMTLDSSGNITTTGGVVNRVKTNGINYGSYGSIGVTGAAGNYAGISFSTYTITLMANNSIQGFYANNNTWRWYYNNGTFVASDERIKTNIRDIDDGEALEQIRLIEPKKYDYIDKEARGTRTVYGFIAQQIESVLPQAVTTVGDQVIPDVYAWATKSEAVEDDGTISMDGAGVPVTFDVGETVCMYTISDEKKTWYNEKCTWVSEDKTSFRVDETETAIPSGPVFVHGRKVDDFKMLKKDYVFTVAVSALQEADREIQRLKAQNASFESRLAALEEAATAPSPS